MTGGRSTPAPDDIYLRPVAESDLEIFFEQQLDSEAAHMVAFTRKDPTNREAFLAHWAKSLADQNVVARTIVVAGEVAGHVVSYQEGERREVGYWLGRGYWGKGLATSALKLLLQEIETRPLYARVAKDNLASLRVLQKCGFNIYGEDRGFSNARGTEVEEFIVILKPAAATSAPSGA